MNIKSKKKAQQVKALAIRPKKQCSIFQNSPIPENCPLTSLHVCHGNCVYMHVHTHVKIKFKEINSRETLSSQRINTRKCSYIALFAYVYGVWYMHDHQG